MPTRFYTNEFDKCVSSYDSISFCFDSLSAATFLRQIGLLSFSVASILYFWKKKKLSVLVPRRKDESGDEVWTQIGAEGWEEDIRERLRWESPNEDECQLCSGLWGQCLYHSASETTATATVHRGESTNLCCRSLWAEKKGNLFLFLFTFIYTRTWTQTISSHSSYLREKIEFVSYCPLSGDVGVCVRAWLLLVYIRVLNCGTVLSIWARQIYLCCCSFMHLLFPKRIGMHQWKRE